MYADQSQSSEHYGHFFDVTHSFKLDSSTYHVLGLRKDRPFYRNTYYIFNCTEHEGQPGTNRRSGCQFQAGERKTSISVDDFNVNSMSNETRKSVGLRPRTQSLKKVEVDPKPINEMLVKTMKSERRAILDALRKEMNLKKKTIIRTMKKQNQSILDATAAANKNEEIIRLLEEQKSLLIDSYEKCIQSTVSSIDTLKQTLIEQLDTQHNALKSMEEVQQKLVQTIDNEVKKIMEKNEEILRLTTAENQSIRQLENNLAKKIDNFGRTKKNESAELQQLFEEQQRVLTNTITEQQNLSLDRIKATMTNVIQEQQITMPKVDEKRNSQSNIDEFEYRVSDSKPIRRTSSRQPNRRTQTAGSSTSSKIIAKHLPDQHLFRVSIRSVEPAHLYAKLQIDGMEYSRRLYTLCQPDAYQRDLHNCYISPPAKDGPCEVTIYAKTHQEATYRAAFSIRLPGTNISQSTPLPFVHQAFEQHQCTLVEPLRRLLRQNEEVLIHMIVPGAQTIKLRNGNDNIELNAVEFNNEIVKKKIRIRGEVTILGSWDGKSDETICVFSMLPS